MDEAPALVAVDIPIGLPRISKRGGRAAEIEVRKTLGRRRQSSVFPTPSRATLKAGSFSEACAIERRHSEPPKGISQQTFNILSKISCVDIVARQRPGLIFECHPEVTFCVMNSMSPMKLRKKAKAGLEERRNQLTNNGYSKSFLISRIGRSAECGWDDQLDACAAAWTAERILNKAAIRFPLEPDLDDCELDMAIWA